VRQFHAEEYTQKGLIDHAEPFSGAVDLLRALRQRGVKSALASSAKEEEVERYLGMLGGREAIDAVTMASDVSATKPAGDVFASALEKLGRPASALVVGDTVYDVASASKLDLPCIGLRSGGIEEQLLREDGAVLIYDGPAELLAHLDEVLNRQDLKRLAASAS
jgi:HAD superfamily hydrolase (TIGR01549 family)